MENLTGGTPPARPLPCVVPCKLYFAILQQKNKFGYLYKFNSERMANTGVMLPVDESGNPDYTFMEQYVKRVKETIKLQYLQGKMAVIV